MSWCFVVDTVVQALQMARTKSANAWTNCLGHLHGILCKSEQRGHFLANLASDILKLFSQRHAQYADTKDGLDLFGLLCDVIVLLSNPFYVPCIPTKQLERLGDTVQAFFLVKDPSHVRSVKARFALLHHTSQSTVIAPFLFAWFDRTCFQEKESK